MRPQLADGFSWVERGSHQALVCDPLAPLAPHLFTTRQWDLGSAESPAALDSAWKDVAAALGGSPGRLERLRQVHGASVVVRRADTALGTNDLPEADIIVTDDPGVVIAIQTADCVPLLMADRKTGAVAAAHAGWRGLAAGLPQLAVRALATNFGARARDLIVAVGPSISAASYEVGAEVRDRFAAAGFGWSLPEGFPSATRPGLWLFDGWRSARDQLVGAGVDGADIHVSRLCTFTNTELCCSYRRDGRRAGRMAAAIRMRHS
jgi:YfiH family protein